jgi:hypothetical protein
MEIVGSEGCIAFRGGDARELALCPHPIMLPLDSTQKWEPIPLSDVSLHSGNQLAIRDLIAAIETDREPLSSAADAVAALEMILGAYESQLTGARVPFPMKNRKHPLAA